MNEYLIREQVISELRHKKLPMGHAVGILLREFHPTEVIKIVAEEVERRMEELESRISASESGYVQVREK